MLAIDVGAIKFSIIKLTGWSNCEIASKCNKYVVVNKLYKIIMLNNTCKLSWFWLASLDT